MAHYAILAPEAGGHLFPMGSLGRELLRRGHRVTVIGRNKAAPLTRQLDLPLYELPSDRIPQRRPVFRPFRSAARLLGAGSYLGLRDRFCLHVQMILELVPQAIRELAVDGLLVDQAILAGGTVAESLGLPYVSVCSALHWNEEPDLPPHYTGWPYREGSIARCRNRLGYAAWHRFMAPALALLNRYRREWKLPPLRNVYGIYSPLAQLAQTCAEFDFPRRQRPATFHYVGALAAQRASGEDQFPWDRLDGRPLIYASLGTVSANQRTKTFQNIASACCGLHAQLVISAGKWAVENEFSPNPLDGLPGDPLVVGFAPQTKLLERTRLLITHGGQNTVAEAISRTVPMIVLPRGADQPAMAARIERAGIGLRSEFRSDPGSLRRLIERLLSEPSFRDNSLAMQQALAATGGVCRAAEIAEQALTTARPVLARS